MLSGMSRLLTVQRHVAGNAQWQLENLHPLLGAEAAKAQSVALRALLHAFSHEVPSVADCHRKDLLYLLDCISPSRQHHNSLLRSPESGDCGTL